MEAPITIKEIYTAINSLKPYCACGQDCLSTEFHKQFAGSLVCKLKNLFQTSIELKTIPIFWKEAKIILPKQRKDLALPGCYRPISLFNTDYKGPLSILASHLNLILSNYIDQDQATVMKIGH